MKNKVSTETQEQAMKVAKATQKKGQTKEQTKLIAQGIEKGIAEFKKQQSKKLRERDKQRKKVVKSQKEITAELPQEKAGFNVSKVLPWLLLAVSWLGFIIFIPTFM
ncbi:DUF2956 domain-containing protein [Thalassotalea piscium]|uniref:CRISPR/Cas system CMR subunit Cmr6 (Cas7 group RAMP superfamily) n=1 Tax=Thalassotalea piscium TaxID=1230533 RepID=A0A7X0NHF0_9GAMM|nr:DUF2956 domain-containing protein [Thalassotalea piscium]MBB6543410.1 CRISPR/Cas system CMR subunit Cmr6 (Cas7 group RAMP superfamily) [Thalassotalea piscium]